MSPSTPATAMDSTSNKMASTTDDAAVTTKVKAALLAEPGLRSMEIHVDTKDGVVTLTGTPDSSAASRDKAVVVARNVAGVKDVVDQMASKSEPGRERAEGWVRRRVTSPRTGGAVRDDACTGRIGARRPTRRDLGAPEQGRRGGRKQLQRGGKCRFREDEEAEGTPFVSRLPEWQAAVNSPPVGVARRAGLGLAGALVWMTHPGLPPRRSRRPSGKKIQTPYRSHRGTNRREVECNGMRARRW